MSVLSKSFAAGYSCFSAWADLCDRINVFPVADGDTGTNLRISLAPFRDPLEDIDATRDSLARCATGNSGNIAAAFFREFCQADTLADVAEKAALGRDKAWQAIACPCAGTMLSVFDSLVMVLVSDVEVKALYPLLSNELQAAVRNTSRLLPDLQKAGVVDSGALAMYVFFDGFFRDVTGQHIENFKSILEIFPGQLAVNSSFHPAETDCYCVDAVIRVKDGYANAKDDIAGMGESVVVVGDESLLKVHIHSPAPETLRGRIGVLGDIVHWSAEEIDQGIAEHSAMLTSIAPLHIVTDSAGSITREMARRHGLSLLDSYIVCGDTSRPESLYSPEQIYPLMRKGIKVTTAQASTFERHQYYRSICQQFGSSLYLCVGSAFTGNYHVAVAWKKDHDPDNQLIILDTGAASGRLALIALLTARYTKDIGADGSAEKVVGFAQKAMAVCEEYVFIDELKYLVAGGRVNRASGFFGDLLSMKPVISPTSGGVRKVGVVRSSKGQLDFAMEKLRERFSESGAPVIMLQYSDNREWLAATVEKKVRTLLPQAEILLTPISLTSGVHMGPGTWSMAFCPAQKE